MGSFLQFLEPKKLVAAFEIFYCSIEHFPASTFSVCAGQTIFFSSVHKQWYEVVYEQYSWIPFKQFCLFDMYLLMFINSCIA